MSSKGEHLGHGSGVGKHDVELRPQTSVLTRQHHIAQMAKKYANQPLTTLHHHLDLLWLGEAFRRVRRDSAPGVDAVSVADYEQDLEGNLKDLLERVKSGSYKAPPVRRCYIPKNGSETRPIGIPTTENKVLERAIVMLLEPIYESDFHDCSYGFRPQRGPPQALSNIRAQLMGMKGAWVVDVDIRKYFDSIPHEKLREILRYRIKDKVILRLIDKWLKAGVWENGQVSSFDEGTPQGGVISPMLSNIYLHEVLDKWFYQQIQPHLAGKAQLTRFADDFLLVVEKREDAEGLFVKLEERLSQWGLTIHPDKTSLIDFRHPWYSSAKPGTFTFLGFVHYWGKTRGGGRAVMKKTAKQRFNRILKNIEQWCKHNRHQPLAWQHRRLCEKLRGHCSYYGITGNSHALTHLRYEVLKVWHKWLNRRSRKRDGMRWKRFNVLISGPYYIPQMNIVHSAYKPVQECLTL